MLAEVNQIDLIYREDSDKVLASPPTTKKRASLQSDYG